MRKKMPETEYRASRVCRVLSNPTAYKTVKLLFHKRRNPSELARAIGVSVPTISRVLRDLRNIDLIRYEVEVNKRIYWLKDQTVIEIINQLEKFVQRIRVKKL